MRDTELLIPAGSLDVLKTAVIYGADAVYLGGEAFGLRAKALPLPMRGALRFISLPISWRIMMTWPVWSSILRS